MNAELPHPHDPEEIEATAAVWLSLRDRGMTESETAEFMRWLQLSPKHAEAFAELDAVWRDFNRTAALRPTAAATPEPELLAPRSRSPARRRASRVWVPLAAAATIALAWAGWAGFNAARPTAETDVGAFQKLDLPDGSVVQLNTDSAIKVHYSDHERRVELLRGEAHFDVAKNPARPFIVAANHVAVRAVGTAFNVRLREDAVDVLVTEGKVQVNDTVKGASLLPAVADQSGPPLLVEGESVRVKLLTEPEKDAPPVVAISEVGAIEMHRALAWQERRLEFEDLPLADVVAEFNRYNRTKLVIADPALNAKHFSGTFRADAYEPFVRLLEENFGVASERTGQGIELRAAR
ncbi:MAG: FecR domain-containing protein [Candidatus Didemnitutus sp.]|nr:FecR domain-containing protein [Candidatus Didemnitutus sp.]